MRISIIEKDMFASLLRYGEIILPDYSWSEISDEFAEEEAIRLILREGNPIEYPSQYILVRDKNEVHDSKLRIQSIDALMAADDESFRLFSKQFREDLVIQSTKYSNLFTEYIDGQFKKEQILKGIKSFRRLCGMAVNDDYSQEVEDIYHGLSNRLLYRHHYLFPPEERNSPYQLMIGYDRHAPYSKAWVGYFCDVIETFCYHMKPELGYAESVAEGTNVFKIIKSLEGASSSAINLAIKNEPFVLKCNEFFTKPGGYLVPYLFFILRDRLRNTESVFSQSKTIESMKSVFPDAFDTAVTYIGGFFGYDRFYEDYYSSLQLPIIRKTEPKPVYVEEPKASCSRKKKKQDTAAKQEILGGVFLDGLPLYKELYDVIDSSLSPGKEKLELLKGLCMQKDNQETLEEIKAMLKSSIEKKDAIMKALSLSKYPGKSITKIKKYYQ